MTSRALFATPRIAVQKGDFLGSGVPYWPLEAAILASLLRSRGWSVEFWDLFGSDPFRLTEERDFYWQGVPIERMIEDRGRSSVEGADAVFIYALSAMSHRDQLGMTRALRQAGARRTVVFENSQAVTGYDLSWKAADFALAGVDFILLGEPYANWPEIESFILGSSGERPPNLLDPSNPSEKKVRLALDPASTPVPAWDLVPFRNYWRLPYAHGPKRAAYFPILTSRGCPYPCTFCVVPATNSQRWRPRSPEEVVAEMEELARRYGVTEFHWEDLNPTINRSRIQKICQLLVQSGRRWRFGLVSGTKAETLDVPTVDWMARAGCDYVSISPESGSGEILKSMRKPFDHAHGLRMVREMELRGIHTQACFVLGHPGEGGAELKKTERYVKDLVRAGVGEVAFFVISPLPGSALYSEIKTEGADEALWSFSPRHRVDYRWLDRERRRLVIRFLMWKAAFQPVRFARQVLNAVCGTPWTKMEMLPRRVAFMTGLRLRRWMSA